MAVFWRRRHFHYYTMSHNFSKFQYQIFACFDLLCFFRIIWVGKLSFFSLVIKITFLLGHFLSEFLKIQHIQMHISRTGGIISTLKERYRQADRLTWRTDMTICRGGELTWLVKITHCDFYIWDHLYDLSLTLTLTISLTFIIHHTPTAYR